MTLKLMQDLLVADQITWFQDLGLIDHSNKIKSDPLAITTIMEDSLLFKDKGLEFNETDNNDL